MGHRSGLPDLVAAHHEARGARATIERLSRAGIDGGAIVLIGNAEVVTAGRYGDRQTDRGSSLALGGRILRGVAWGVAPGALFGAVLLAVTTTPSLAAVSGGAAGGAVFGTAVGALIGVLAIPTMATSWERTFAPTVSGGMTVGVRIDSERDDRRARRVLRVSAAHSVREVVDLDEIDDDPLAHLGA